MGEGRYFVGGMTEEQATTKPKRARKAAKPEANEPFERKLWKTADKLRKNIDASQYKNVVLGLIFLKYIGDAFERAHELLSAGKGELAGADPEDPDEYRAQNAFFVPPIARWKFIQANARNKKILLENGSEVNIGGLLDEAMDAIERQNPVSLKDVLPKGYARPNVDVATLAGLIDEISKTELKEHDDKGRDLLGRVYEYFLGQFANAEGKKGGQFYTPESVVTLLAEMLEPYDGRVFDPCCGSGGMFVQSAKFVRAHADHYNEKPNGTDVAKHISVYGQESNIETWRLCKMNLAIRHIDSSNIKWNNEGSFLNDAHPGLKADYIMANPPFNDSDWDGDKLRTDARWKQHGLPPEGNANFGWVQHFLHHLTPGGAAGFVLSNGSLSSNQSGEGDIRKSIIEADMVDCIVMMPKQLFFNTGIPACLWFLRRNRTQRKGETLFIDASELGYMEDRTHRILRQADIARVAGTYHQWRTGERYLDEKGFCKSATLEDITKHKFVLTPGRYVGIPDEVDDGIPFEQKLKTITDALREQMAEGDKSAKEIKEQLNKIDIKL